jgi:hypothetical protein
MWLRFLGIMFIAYLMVTGCVRNTDYQSASVVSIVQPQDTIISGQSIQPVIHLSYVGTSNNSTVCTLSVRIWRYKVKMDSLGFISMDTIQSIVEYDTFVVSTITPGINSMRLPAWCPFWSDIYLIGQHHKVEVIAHMVNGLHHINNILIDNFIVKARNYDLQVNYVGLFNDNDVISDDTISVGVTYRPVSNVSNSPLGPTVTFRSWYKILRLPGSTIIYSRYLNGTLQPGQDTCICCQSGWTPNDTGLYKVTSWLETRGIDSIPDNSLMDRYFYARPTIR